MSVLHLAAVNGFLRLDHTNLFDAAPTFMDLGTVSDFKSVPRFFQNPQVFQNPQESFRRYLG
jgi:hypothetical protein